MQKLLAKNIWQNRKKSVLLHPISKLIFIGIGPLAQLVRASDS